MRSQEMENLLNKKHIMMNTNYEATCYTFEDAHTDCINNKTYGFVSPIFFTREGDLMFICRSGNPYVKSIWSHTLEKPEPYTTF